MGQIRGENTGGGEEFFLKPCPPQGKSEMAPLVESTGVYISSTRNFIRTTGSRIRQVTGDPRETHWFKQRIGLTMQRGNAL